MEVLEQLAHLGWAFAPLALLAVPRAGWWSPLVGSVAGALLGAPREFVDQLPIERPWDTVLDLSMFALGGCLAGVFAWLRPTAWATPPKRP
jgi:hypothetical protein